MKKFLLTAVLSFIAGLVYAFVKSDVKIEFECCDCDNCNCCEDCEE